MGWSGSGGYYSARDSMCKYVNQELKPELEDLGCITSTKNFGSEVWYMKKDNPLCMGVTKVRKHVSDGSAEFMTKTIDWDMGPYCSSLPPLKYLKAWSVAVLEALKVEFEDAASLLTHKESFVQEWAKKGLEEGSFPEPAMFIKKNFKKYIDYGLENK